jgi:mannose-6-phosphate isomerase-like protein (cupin superfamily)
MSMITVLISLLLAADGGQMFSSQQIEAKAGELHRKVKDGLASETLGNWGNYSLLAAHREASGQAELHEKQSDILIIRDGGADLILGGRITDGKSTAPNEVRGTKIEGGETRHVKAGDVIQIPPRTPHQMILRNGGRIDYLAVKIDSM